MKIELGEEVKSELRAVRAMAWNLVTDSATETGLFHVENNFWWDLEVTTHIISNICTQVRKLK